MLAEDPLNWKESFELFECINGAVWFIRPIKSVIISIDSSRDGDGVKPNVWVSWKHDSSEANIVSETVELSLESKESSEW